MTEMKKEAPAGPAPTGDEGAGQPHGQNATGPTAGLVPEKRFPQHQPPLARHTGTLSCHREALWRSPGHRTDWRAGTRNSQTRRGEPGYCWSLWTRLLAAWPASPPGAPAPLAGLLPCDPRSKGEAGAEAHARFVSPVTAVTAVPPVTKAISEVMTSSLFNEKTKQARISQAGARRF